MSPIPENMDELIRRLESAHEQFGDGFAGNRLFSRHRVTFYALKSDAAPSIDKVRANAYGKLGPLLVTQADGVVIPFTGDFYTVVEANGKDGHLEVLKIKKLSDYEVEAQFSLVKLSRASGVPYEMEWDTLEEVIGRSSAWPGRFGYVELSDGYKTEEPLASPSDLFDALLGYYPLRYVPSRLEVKGAGSHYIRSIHTVFKPGTTEPAGIVMEDINAKPNLGIRFELQDEIGQAIPGVTLEEFLKRPGALTGATYQPYFLSAPGWEELDQSKRDFAHQARVRARGTKLPNIPYERLQTIQGGITVRLAKLDSLRISEMIREFEHFGAASLLGRWAAEGKVLDLTKEFLSALSRNVEAMYRSGLYMFANGGITHTYSYGNLVSKLYSQGQKMENEPAWRMFRNNFALLGNIGDLADLAEYDGGTGSAEFGKRYYLYFASRLIETWVSLGLLTLEEAARPDLLEAYLAGWEKRPDWAEGMSKIPPTDQFELIEDPPGTKIFAMRIKGVPDSPLPVVESRNENDDWTEGSYPVEPDYGVGFPFLEKDREHPRPIPPTRFMKWFYDQFARFSGERRNYFDSISYQGHLDKRNDMECRWLILKDLLTDEKSWNDYGLREEGIEADTRDLFLGLQDALIHHRHLVQWGDQELSIENAVLEFNKRLDILHSLEYQSDLSHLARSVPGSQSNNDAEKLIQEWLTWFPDLPVQREFLKLLEQKGNSQSWEQSGIYFSTFYENHLYFPLVLGIEQEFVVLEMASGKFYGTNAYSPYNTRYWNQNSKYQKICLLGPTYGRHLAAVIPRDLYKSLQLTHPSWPPAEPIAADREKTFQFLSDLKRHSIGFSNLIKDFERMWEGKMCKPLGARWDEYSSVSPLQLFFLSAGEATDEISHLAVQFYNQWDTQLRAAWEKACEDQDNEGAHRQFRALVKIVVLEFNYAVKERLARAKNEIPRPSFGHAA
jgi:hypothetical protein